jgi:hypothetical protein
MDKQLESNCLFKHIGNVSNNACRMICCTELGLTRPYIYCIYIKRVTCNMGEKKRMKKLDDGQLLLTVTDKRQTRQNISDRIISGRKSHSALDTKTY